MNWGDYSPYFTRDEFKCKHTGLCDMQSVFMDKLLAMRISTSMPFVITSGYRHPSHPVEARKGHSQGEHTRGACCDIACSNASQRFILVQAAIRQGFTRIGIASNFIHVGMGGAGLPNNVIWEYA